MMRRVLVTLCSAGMALVAVAQAPAQTSPSNPFVGSTGDIQVEVLGTGADVYLVSGGGGNTIAVVDEASGGIVLVDPKPKGWGKKVVDALSGVTDLPVTTIINTHAREPQIGGNADFPMAARIIAHANTKARMATLDAFTGANARFLPNTTVTTTTYSLLDGPNRIDLYAFGAGQTDGDLVVVFPAWKLAYLGELFPSKRVPIVDTARGGSAIALAQTLMRAATEIKGMVKIVTGAAQARNQYFLGPMRAVTAPGGVASSWADFEEYAAFNAALVAATKAAHDAGKSVDDAVTTLALPARFAKYDMSGAKEYVAGIYAELKR